MTATKLRRAADARRAAAERRGETGGELEYRAARSAVTGVGAARQVGMPTQIRAAQEVRNGKTMIHTSGYFTRYGREYPMWDEFGEYAEVILTGAGRATLASLPDVAFLVNHKGVTMARTRSGTLELREDGTGGFHDAWLNPERQDVKDLVIAINDGDITEMSFAFMIPELSGEWNDDFTVYAISAYVMDRGDVSAVNYGANPYTDISARTGELLRDLEHLPQGAKREAALRLGGRPLMIDVTPGQAPTVIDPDRPKRERVNVSWRSAAPAVDPKAPAWERRLRSQHVDIANRLVAYATERDLTIPELPMVALPWFEITNAYETEDQGSATDILIYESIGGSFGVNASSFAEQLAEIDTDWINLRINSLGGSVFDAIAMHSSLLHHPARVHSWIDGIAASAATVVAMAGDRITVMPGGEMMIHKASMMIDGNDDDAERMRDHLRRQSENIAGMYAARAGGDVAEWMALMAAETWMFGQEAVDMGLADDVWVRPEGRGSEERHYGDPRLTKRHDTRRYRYSGRAAAPAPRRFRAGVGESEAARPTILEINELVRDGIAPRPKPEPQDTGTSEDQPMGRSIALIEAQLLRDQG
jgi:HK97 family phage prohead protease